MPSPRTSALAAAAAPGFVLERSEAVPALIGRHEDFLFISGLGGSARDVGAVTGDGAHVYSLGGAMGVICVRIEQPQDVIPAAGAALTVAFKSGQAVAVLLSQRLIGAKPF